MHRKGLKSVEIKYVQGKWATPNDAPPTQGSIGTLNEPASGSTQAQFMLTSISPGLARDQRVGNKVFLRHLRITGMLQASVAAAAVAEVYVTILIVRVKDAQGAIAKFDSDTPSVPNIYEFIGNTAFPPSINGQANGRQAYINNWRYINSRWRDDFTILKKKVLKVGKPDGNPPLKKMFKITCPIFKPAYWDDSQYPQDGHLYIYWWCDQVLTLGSGEPQANERPTMWGSWRVSYTDV